MKLYRTLVRKRNLRLPFKEQKGSILLLILVLVSILGVASIQFAEQNSRFNTMASSNISQADARLFVEAAINTVYSQFLNHHDLNADNIADNSQLSFDPLTSSPSLKYLYYVSSDGVNIDQTAPSILQKIANGDASNTPSQTLSSQVVALATNKIIVSDLFSIDFKPLVFVMNEDGLIVSSNHSFDAETLPTKAAVWLEIIADASDSSLLNIYVQGVGSTRNARAYLQRYIGTISVGSAAVLGNSLSAFTQNSVI